MRITQKKILFGGILCLFNFCAVFAQCPPNIDFEQGSFNGWTCFSGIARSVNNQNVISLTNVGQIPGRHEIIPSFPFPGYDEYGNFPKSCPNGSGYSIKLGDNTGKHEAEGIEYVFTIPPTATEFSLVYHYALVIEDPGHQLHEQPRLRIEVTNVTDDEPLNCSSISFVAGANLPGFQLSPRSYGTRRFYYKDWSANTIKLNGLQGKTIQLLIKNADCVFFDHFGYTYLDINTECNGFMPGTSYCAGDTAVNVKAPIGYQSYKWFNNNFTQVLSQQQVFHIQPPPAPGTVLALELTPYNGYGCKDTLMIPFRNDLVIPADAGVNKTICTNDSVRLGIPPSANAIYKWSPAHGLGSTSISNPAAFPDTDTTYTLTVRSEGGGCAGTDQVRITRRVLDTSIAVSGSNPYCINTGNPPVLSVANADVIQWYKDNQPLSGANQFSLSPALTGSYKASLKYNVCAAAVFTKELNVVIDRPAPATRYADVLTPLNFPIRLNARTIGNNARWSPAFQLDDITNYNPLFRGTQPQLYTVSLTTETGCITVDTVYVKPYKKIAIYVPSAFNPESAGLNNHLRPLLLGFAKVNYFRIYDRWGKLLFQAENDYPGWDGKIKGLYPEIQSVVWILEAVDVDGKTHQAKGATVLIR
ncbi:MAG: hypothetical protein WAT19_04720 [Ferruginibacter sp.]